MGPSRASDLALLWLWCRPAAIADSTPSLGTSYAKGVALKKRERESKNHLQCHHMEATLNILILSQYILSCVYFVPELEIIFSL